MKGNRLSPLRWGTNFLHGRIRPRAFLCKAISQWIEPDILLHAEIALQQQFFRTDQNDSLTFFVLCISPFRIFVCCGVFARPTHSDRNISYDPSEISRFLGEDSYDSLEYGFSTFSLLLFFVPHDRGVVDFFVQTCTSVNAGPISWCDRQRAVCAEVLVENVTTCEIGETRLRKIRRKSYLGARSGARGCKLVAFHILSTDY